MRNPSSDLYLRIEDIQLIARLNLVIPEDEDPAIVLFDGVCNLCNAAVNFLIDHDPNGRFKFGALQSEAVEPILEHYGIHPDHLDSFVLVDDKQVYRRSEAALRIAWRLGGAWRLLYPLLLLPRPFRDAAYDWVAANRYRWFGKREVCRIPTPELIARFIA
jgi:predicted DCC family thiol-disulfide oxidoreductase YuxK